MWGGSGGPVGHGERAGAGQGLPVGPEEKGYLAEPPAAVFSGGSGLYTLRT